MTMRTTITRWGNSRGVRLPRALLEAVDFGENEHVELEAVEGMIVIRPVKKKRSLDDVFSGYKGTYRPVEEWDPPVGEEAW